MAVSKKLTKDEITAQYTMYTKQWLAGLYMLILGFVVFGGCLTGYLLDIIDIPEFGTVFQIIAVLSFFMLIGGLLYLTSARKIKKQYGGYFDKADRCEADLNKFSMKKVAVVTAVIVAIILIIMAVSLLPSDSGTVFTNKYGTADTICYVPGCTNNIAPSGDTNCCVQHSNTCSQCGCYIDSDAMLCMECIEDALP